MFKKFLMGTALAATILGTAGAANLTLMSGPQDPSQLLATINTLIQSINFGVNGRLAAYVTAAGPGTTAEASMFSYSLPASQLANDGDAVRVVCWGTTQSNTNAKTVKLYFGNSSITTANAGLASGAYNGVKWKLNLTVMRSGAATQVVMGEGQIGASPISIYTNAGTDTLTSAVTIKCTGTAPTSAGDITAQGMLVQQVK